MPRRTLLDFYADLSSTPGEFVVYDDGYRSWSYSYAEVTEAARAFAGRLSSEGIVKGDAVTIWSENRAEWIIALWGCLLEGVVLVPIDYRASADFLLRVATIVDTRVVLVGDAVERDALGDARLVWHLSTLRGTDAAAESVSSELHQEQEAAAAGPVAPKLRKEQEAAAAEDTAEIIFTSGAT